MADVPDVFGDPVAVAVLTLVVAAIILYQRDLSWREYRPLHQFKLKLFPVLDEYTTLFVVSRKGGRTDGEYVTTVEGDIPSVFKRLRENGGSPHLLNAVKTRPTPGGSGLQYAQAHLVWLHGDGTQTEAYLFKAADGGTDVYAHHEDAVSGPIDHYETPDQRDGDPRGVVRAALEVAA